MVVTSRILRGVSIFQGGKDHLSHRLIAKGFSRRGAALILWIIAALLSMLSLFITIASKDIGVAIALFGLIVMGFLFLQFFRSSLNV